MKIAIYGVAKNEELNVSGWYESSKDADYHFILDTGSTDNTVSIAKEFGINVLSASFDPWDESLAKNVALSFLPKDIDICILLDLDQRILNKDWKTVLVNLNCFQYDAIEHYLIDSIDNYNNDLNLTRGMLMHKRNNWYWHKYRPRLESYIDYPKILKCDLKIVNGYEASEKRFVDRESLYLNAYENEYKKILKSNKESDLIYLLEIIAHHAFVFFETDDFVNFLNKQKEFYQIYNKLSKNVIVHNSHIDDYSSRFILANAVLNPKNAYDLLSKVKPTSIIKKTALLKQNIIMFWLGKENLVEELFGLSNTELISIYADTKTGKFKIKLAENSYNYFVKTKI